MLDRIQLFCFLASYLVAFGLECAQWWGRNWVRRVAALLFGVAGLVAHTGYLLARSQAAQLPPLLSSSRDWLLVLAWLEVVAYLFLTTFDRDLLVGVFLSPIVLLLVSAAGLVSTEPNTSLDSLRGWKMLHASLLVLGVLGVVVAFVLGMMYLVQQSRLKQHHALRTGTRLPSLEKLARLNRWSVLLAFPLLTLGMGTGVGLAVRAGRGAPPHLFADPVIAGSTLVWIGMAGLFVWLLVSPRSTGKQVASLTLWAGGFLLVTLIGLQVLTGRKVFHLETWHVHAPTPNRPCQPGGATVRRSLPPPPPLSLSCLTRAQRGST